MTNPSLLPFTSQKLFTVTESHHFPFLALPPFRLVTLRYFSDGPTNLSNSNFIMKSSFASTGLAGSAYRTELFNLTGLLKTVVVEFVLTEETRDI